MDITLALTKEHIKKIEDAVPFLPTLLALEALADGRRFEPPLQGDGSGYHLGYALAGYFDKWPASQAIRPSEVKELEIKAPTYN